MVVVNGSEYSLSQLVVVGKSGSQPRPLAKLSVLASKECAFIPIDFVPPMWTKTAFDMPDDVGYCPVSFRLAAPVSGLTPRTRQAETRPETEHPALAGELSSIRAQLAALWTQAKVA